MQLPLAMTVSVAGLRKAMRMPPLIIALSLGYGVVAAGLFYTFFTTETWIADRGILSVGTWDLPEAGRYPLMAVTGLPFAAGWAIAGTFVRARVLAHEGKRDGRSSLLGSSPTAPRCVALGTISGIADGVATVLVFAATRTATRHHALSAEIGVPLLAATWLLLWAASRAVMGLATSGVVLAAQTALRAIRRSARELSGRRLTVIASGWPLVTVALTAGLVLVAAGEHNTIVGLVIITLPALMGVLVAVDACIESAWYDHLHRKVSATEVAAIFE